MNKPLNHTNNSSINGSLTLSGSKSESNRLLILQKLLTNVKISNLSNSDDTIVLQKALVSEADTIDIGHAGTAMRFLTAYLAIQEGKTSILSGSKRMQERPISPLVNALTHLGASIKYLNIEGYPPLQIVGKKLSKKEVYISGSISSQYISSLLLISTAFNDGLKINLTGKITSIPYIKMTLSLLDTLGFVTSFNKKVILIKKPKVNKPIRVSVEPDWSSASYFYSLAALQPNTKIVLQGFKKNSIQGDCVLSDIYKLFGVKTKFDTSGITIFSDKEVNKDSKISLNLVNTPDLAQTIAVTCLGLKKPCLLTGLHTLKIKETDRLLALKTELEKLGASVIVTDDSLQLFSVESLNKNILINTYHDHRMAMAFTPLSVLVPIVIENPKVVSKSYPNFWKDWKQLFITSY